MGWELEGDDCVLRVRTRKPFERFKVDATRGLMQGLSGLVTTHRWDGNVCQISSPGAKAVLTFDHGEVACKVRIGSFPATFFKDKILSDIQATTLDVCGVISSANRQVFIVHGHNEANRLELKDFLVTLDLSPVILDQEDDRGLTIIEKFEYYAASCSFAFVLMTPDDEMVGSYEAAPRRHARQNVLIELGYFMAYLGRERVLIVHKGELEIPSDIHGVVYLKFNDKVVEVAERIRQRLKGVGLLS